MNNSVVVEELLESSNEIKNEVDSLLEVINTINSECDAIEGAANTLNSYNGQLASSPRIEDAFFLVNSPSLINVILKNGKNKQRVWTTWQITGVENITNAVQAIKEELAELEEPLESIGMSATEAELSAENIDEYNDMILELLSSGNVVSGDLLANAFANLKDNITWDEYSAERGNWSGVLDENVQWWINGVLLFEKDEKTGSYLIKKQDENGNWVGMGWTDEAGVLAYIGGFRTNSKDIRKKTSTKENDETKEEIKEEKMATNNKSPQANARSQRKNYQTIADKAYNGDRQAQQEVINILLSVVEQAHNETGAPRSALVAQAILESGWLKASAGENNIMSMNVFDDWTNAQWESIWKGNSEICNVPQENSAGVWEYGNEGMRSYPNMEQAVEDNARFLVQYKITGNFSEMTNEMKQQKIAEVSQMSASEYIDKIKGYATDSSYASKLNSIVNDFNLTQYDQPIIN